MSGGPGQLLLATAAAVVGYVVSGGNPVGAAIGFQIGMTAGGIIWPLDGGTQAGPRLADREVQSSAYGASISILYGSYRASGNIIWAKDIEEKSDFKRVGKTLFSRGTKVWSYTYFGHFAVAVCEGPVSGIGRIWADNKLIYDPDSTTAGKYDRYITTYTGTEDQMPNPSIQADKGADQTPAFRGTAYVVFSGLPLADFSNRVPNISIEVGGLARAAEWHDGSVPNISGTDWNYAPAQPYRVANTHATYLTVVDTRTLTYQQFEPFNHAVVTSSYVDGELVTTTTYPVQDATIAAFGGIYGAGVDSTLYTYPLIDPTSGDIIVFLQGVTSRSAVARFRVTSSAVTMLWVRAFFTDIGVGSSYIFGGKIWMIDQFQRVTYCIDLATGAELWQHDHRLEVSPSPSIYDLIKSATFKASDGTIFWTWAGEASYEAGLLVAGGRIARQSLLTGAILSQRAGFLSADAPFSAVYDTTTDKVIIVHAAGFKTLDPTTLATVSDFPVTGAWQKVGTQLRVEGTNNAVAGSLWLTDGNNTFWQISTSDFSVLWTGTTDPAVKTSLGSMGEPFHIAGSRATFFGYSGGTQTYKFGSTTVSTTLADIITDICERCDMDSADIDVSELTAQIVPGYGLMRETTGRAALEPLLSSYAVDAPEIDGILRFQKRKTALMATVPYDDFGATSDATETVRVTERRRQEIEMPARVSVTYSSQSRDYENNTQTAKRIDDTIKAGDPRSVEFPLVLDDTDALTLANRLLWLAWVERSSYSFALPPRWLIYDPGDILDIPLVDNVARVMLTRVELGGDGIVRFEAQSTDELAFLPAVGAPVVPVFPGQTVPTIETMDVVALDAPLLSDADDAFGYYVGGQGSSASWTGGAVYASADATSYEYATAVPEPVPTGLTATALPDHPSALTDYTNTVRVVFPYNVEGLASVSLLDMYAGANRILIGAELVGFATVTPISTGVYDLSTLLRGIGGTEYGSSHPSAGVQAVLLDNIISLEEAISGLNQTRYFKGVTSGETLDDVTAETIVGTGVRIRPISPVHIAGSRDGSDNLDITWTRRARLDADWRDLVETPLDEPIEAYEVDILDGSTVVRTISTSSPTASYSAAEQTADGLTPGDPVSLKVYQISTRVGRGFPGSATV